MRNLHISVGVLATLHERKHMLQVESVCINGQSADPTPTPFPGVHNRVIHVLHEGVHLPSAPRCGLHAQEMPFAIGRP